MGDEVNPAVWGLLGAVVGALASVGTTWITNAHAAKLESQRAREVRAEIARAFQRQTLVDLQDALNTLARIALEHHRYDLSQLQEGAPWGESAPSMEMVDSLVDSFREVGKLSERVAHEPLRVAVLVYRDMLTDTLSADSLEVANAMREKVREKFAEITVLLGEYLRSQYELT